MTPGLHFLLQTAASLNPSFISVDAERLAAELRADSDVVKALKGNGDVPEIIRPVDVRFAGKKAALQSLEGALRSAGWKIVQTVALDDGNLALDVQHRQPTDDDALKDLTETALKIEIKYDVRYDGWGCVAQTKRAS